MTSEDTLTFPLLDFSSFTFFGWLVGWLVATFMQVNQTSIKNV